jgi:EmrB/QacA subfamily drug resistance transporter
MEDTGLRRSALVSVTFSNFLTPFMASATYIALPSIAADFNMDAVLLSWVATSFTLASVTSMVPCGRVADFFGRKKIFLLGFIIFTIASLFCGISGSPTMLILSWALQGVGGALIFVQGPAILLSVFPPHERGRVLGISVAAVFAGLSLGPLIGGLMTTALSWRSVFLMNVPLGSIIILLILWKLKTEWVDARDEKFDFIGSIIYCLAIVGFIYGITHLPTWRSFWLIFIGLIGFFVFIKWEMHVESPVFDINLYRNNRLFALSNLAALIHFSGSFAVTFLMSLYLQNIKGLSPQGAGLVLVIQTIVQAIFSPFAGKLSDRVEPGIVAAVGMAVTTLGICSFIFLDEASSLPFILVNLTLLGLGIALFSSPNTNALMSSVEKKFYGQASGSSSTMRQLGMILSMGIVTLLFNLFIGRVEITADVYPAFIRSLKAAFSVFSVLCFGGIFASLARGKMHSSNHTIGDSAGMIPQSAEEPQPQGELSSRKILSARKPSCHFLFLA